MSALSYKCFSLLEGFLSYGNLDDAASANRWLFSTFQFQLHRFQASFWNLGLVCIWSQEGNSNFFFFFFLSSEIFLTWTLSIYLSIYIPTDLVCKDEEISISWCRFSIGFQNIQAKTAVIMIRVCEIFSWVILFFFYFSCWITVYSFTNLLWWTLKQKPLMHIYIYIYIYIYDGAYILGSLSVNQYILIVFLGHWVRKPDGYIFSFILQER